MSAPQVMPRRSPRGVPCMVRAVVAASVRTWLGLQEGEGPRTSRLFAFIFLLTAAAVLARSAQRELFLAAYPRSAIPDAFLLSAGVLALASLGLSALTERLSLVRLTQGMLAGGAVLLGLAFFVVRAWATSGPMMVYVLVEVLLSLSISQAWAVVSEGVDVRSAKRLLPVIGLGASLSWTVGGFAVSGLDGDDQMAALASFQPFIPGLQSPRRLDLVDQSRLALRIYGRHGVTIAEFDDLHSHDIPPWNFFTLCVRLLAVHRQKSVFGYCGLLLSRNRERRISPTLPVERYRTLCGTWRCTFV